MAPFIPQISIAIIATLLTIFGEDLNKSIKRHLRPTHFFTRLLIFVLVCAFGYGALSVFMTRLITEMLSCVGSLALAPIVIGVFLIIGYLAEHKNQM